MADRETRRTDTTARPSARETREAPPVETRDARTERVREPALAVGNGNAVASLVTGLLAATFAFLVVTAPAAVIFGIVAIITGVVGVGRSNAMGGAFKGIAITGLVSGILALVLAIATIVGGVTLWQEFAPELQEQLEQLNG